MTEENSRQGAGGGEVVLFGLCSYINTPHGSSPVASERSHSPFNKLDTMGGRERGRRETEGKEKEREERRKTKSLVITIHRFEWHVCGNMRVMFYIYECDHFHNICVQHFVIL